LYYQDLAQIEKKYAVSYEQEFNLITLAKALPSCSQEVLIKLAKDALWYQVTAANMIKYQQEKYEKNTII
jgi:ABC-type arginine/histidine transport system permease subunit